MVLTMTNQIFSAAEVRDASLARAAEMIRHNMVRSDKWLLRGLLAIYANQTTDEKAGGATVKDNGIGFTVHDAHILTALAERVKSWQSFTDRRYPTPLSPKQMVLLGKLMPKYARQLARIVRENHPREK